MTTKPRLHLRVRDLVEQASYCLWVTPRAIAYKLNDVNHRLFCIRFGQINFTWYVFLSRRWLFKTGLLGGAANTGFCPFPAPAASTCTSIFCIFFFCFFFYNIFELCMHMYEIDVPNSYEGECQVKQSALGVSTSKHTVIALKSRVNHIFGNTTLHSGNRLN